MPKAKRSLKPLPKTLRERKRYILFGVESEGKLDERELGKAMENVFLSLYGSLGSAEINAKIIEFNPEKGLGVIKCSRGNENRVRVALMFLREANGKPMKARTMRCSGSLKALQQSL